MYKEYIKKEVYKNEKSILKRIYLKYFCVQTNAVYLIRKYQHLSRSKYKLHNILAVYYRNKLVTKYGIFVGKNTKIDIGLNLPHPNNIILGDGVSIGKDCVIYQGVTLGGKNRGDYEKNNYPSIGDKCVLFSGSKVLGKVLVANNNVIGANSIILMDTIENAVYVGIPAKMIHKDI